jgi:hypothetical protein
LKRERRALKAFQVQYIEMVFDGGLDKETKRRLELKYRR